MGSWSWYAKPWLLFVRVVAVWATRVLRPSAEETRLRRELEAQRHRALIAETGEANALRELERQRGITRALLEAANPAQGVSENPAEFLPGVSRNSEENPA